MDSGSYVCPIVYNLARNWGQLPWIIFVSVMSGEIIISAVLPILGQKCIICGDNYFVAYGSFLAIFLLMCWCSIAMFLTIYGLFMGKKIKILTKNVRFGPFYPKIYISGKESSF